MREVAFNLLTQS